MFSLSLGGSFTSLLRVQDMPRDTHMPYFEEIKKTTRILISLPSEMSMIYESMTYREIVLR